MMWSLLGSIILDSNTRLLLLRFPCLLFVRVPPAFGQNRILPFYKT
jgi:hypothetical protein